MRKFKLKTIKKKFIAVILAACLFAGSMITAYADDDFEGWTEDNIETVWTVYSTTEWVDVYDSGFYFDVDGSVAKFTNDTFRNTMILDVEYYAGYGTTAVIGGTSWGDICEEVTGGNRYNELLLAIVYQMQKRGLKNKDKTDDLERNDADIAYVCPYLRDVSPDDAYESVRIIYQTLVSAYTHYNATHADDASLYRNDEKLAVVVQGVMYYGTNYCEETDSYTTESSAAYAEEHADELRAAAARWTDFAESVLSNYSCIESSGHKVIG